jgi:hypothetical protein
VGLGQFWTLINAWLNGDVLIVVASVGALGLAAGAYFKSGAADGKLSIEDFIAIAVTAIIGAAVFYGIYLGLK